VFRVEAYLKPFHFVSSLDYVASRRISSTPSFQRYIQARAEQIRACGWQSTSGSKSLTAK
jgi:hypothetical protein